MIAELPLEKGGSAYFFSRYIKEVIMWMKKILLFLIVFIFLTGCARKPPTVGTQALFQTKITNQKSTTDESSSVIAAEPLSLNENNYKSDLGVIIIQIHWGRTWKCGQFENAQLQSLTFTKSPIDKSEVVSLEFVTPSKLFVDNKYLPYAYVVQPGEYLLTAFDVKVARSRTDIMHIKGTKENLIKEGKSIGGTFTVNPGEIVYIGHFGLDCGAQPFLWRYYIDGRSEFERYIDGFRKKYPFVKDVPVQFRLFSTKTLGNPYALDEPTVE